MKKIMLLMIAILVISCLSSPPILADSRSYEYRTFAIMRIMYEQIFGLRVSNPHSREIIEIIIDDSNGIDLQGDADDYGHGKSDNTMGDEDKTDISAGMDADALNNLNFSTD